MFRFEIKLGGLQFRDCMKQLTPLKLSILQGLFVMTCLDSQLLDQTNELTINPQQKIKTLGSQKNLLFFSKEETINNPVYIQISIGSKIKKCLIKRVDQLRQFQKGKSQFDLTEDFGIFKFSYTIRISQEQRNNNFLTIKKVEITKPQAEKVQTSKKQTDFSYFQLDKKDTTESKQNQSDQNLKASQGKVRKRPSKLEKVQHVASLIRQRSLSKGQSQKQHKQNKAQNYHQRKGLDDVITIQKTQSASEGQIRQSQLNKSHRSQSKIDHNQLNQGPFFSNLKSSKRQSQRIQNAADELITTHHPKLDDHSHGHGQHKLSIKLKIVILMLLMGFLFLMYDALDDRFSQKMVIQQSLGRLQKLSKKKEKKKKKHIL